MDELNTHKLTWAALLGRWIEFAQSALALPDDADGRAWRESVPAVIGLQALCMALRDVDQLPADQRALGLNRAHILFEKHVDDLHELFGSQDLHPMLTELITDAQQAMDAAEKIDPGA